MIAAESMSLAVDPLAAGDLLREGEFRPRHKRGPGKP